MMPNGISVNQFSRSETDHYSLAKTLKVQIKS